MKDLINRSDAIDRITNQYLDSDGGRDRYAVGINVGLTKAMNALKDMTPAKPNQCQDCALFDPNWRCGFWHRFTIPEGFCHNYKEKEEEEKNDRIER